MFRAFCFLAAAARVPPPPSQHAGFSPFAAFIDFDFWLCENPPHRPFSQRVARTAGTRHPPLGQFLNRQKKWIFFDGKASVRSGPSCSGALGYAAWN
jgi:hypothetical protein